MVAITACGRCTSEECSLTFGAQADWKPKCIGGESASQRAASMSCYYSYPACKARGCVSYTASADVAPLANVTYRLTQKHAYEGRCIEFAHATPVGELTKSHVVLLDAAPSWHEVACPLSTCAYPPLPPSPPSPPFPPPTGTFSYSACGCTCDVTVQEATGLSALDYGGSHIAMRSQAALDQIVEHEGGCGRLQGVLSCADVEQLAIRAVVSGRRTSAQCVGDYAGRAQAAAWWRSLGSFIDKFVDRSLTSS